MKKDFICKTLTEHCVWLNDAHRDKAKHDKMKKTIPYQRYIGAMEELNVIAKKLGSDCQCQNVFKKGKRHTEANHIGHKMVKI